MTVEVLNEEHVQEVIHEGRAVSVTKKSLRVGANPAVAVEHTSAVGTSQGSVVLIHGFAQNRYTWAISGRSMVAALAEAGFDVWNLELRGHGRSRALGAPNATEFADYVADLRQVIEACSKPPFLIGHSLGGAVAVAAATEAKVAGVIHLAGVYTFAQGNALIRALGRITLDLEPWIRATKVRLSTRAAGRLLGRLYSITEVAGYGFPISGWVPESIERPLLEERLALGFDWTSVEVWLQMSRWATGERFAYRDAFAALDVPLLVVYGDHDALVKRVDAEACYAESGSTDKQLVAFDAFHHQVHWGHVDLILGKLAPVEVWPVLVSWLQARA